MEELKDLVGKKVLEVLQADPEKEGFNEKAFNVRLQQAKIGMQYQANLEISKRIEKSQFIRIVQFVSKDSEERKQYIELAMPKMLPVRRKVGRLN